MNYNVIDIIPNSLSQNDLRVIINKKLYKIIEFMEYNVNEI